MLTILKHKVLISTGLGVLLACLAALFLPWNGENSARLSSKAAQALDNRDFSALAKYVEEYPSLLGDFRETLSRELLKEGMTEHPIFSLTLKRLQEGSPLHARMAKVSLLISKGELENALEESLEIEGGFAEQDFSKISVQPGMIGRMINLLKIAELYYALGKFQEEADAWQKIEQQAGWYAQNPHFTMGSQREAVSLLEKGFKEEGVDLKDYIRFRKKLALEGA